MMERYQAQEDGTCTAMPRKEKYGVMELLDSRNIAIPNYHVPASESIVSTLLKFFRDENVTSISDYGAGVRQYGVTFMSKCQS